MKKNKFKHVTVFDRPYSPEKMAEGHAIHTKRIDVFDAAVFASIRFLIDTEKVSNAAAWYSDE